MLSTTFWIDARAHEERVFTNDDCTKIYAAFTEERPEGPRIRIAAPIHGARSVASIEDLTLVQYNVENLFNYLGKWGYNKRGEWTRIAPPRTKPQARWERLRDNIERANPDIMTWQEVENLQAAQEFVDTQLGGRYRVFLIEGNDSRGIDVALLVRNDLPFDVTIQSHRNLASGGRRIFSRDLVTAEFRAPGAPAEQEPLFRIFHTHNKSQRDSPGDPRSVSVRTLQVEEQARIAEIFERTEPNVPIFLMGDMNADVRNAAEFRPIWAQGFRDGFNVAPNSPEPVDRVTQAYFPEGGSPVYSQLDGIFVSRAGQSPGLVRSLEVVPDRFPDGRPMPLPRTFQERERQASDHRALRMRIAFNRLYQDWLARNRTAPR